MGWKFWRRKKKEEEGTPVVEEPKKELSSLDKKCIEHGRPDLCEPLSWTLSLEPRNRDVNGLLAEENAVNYRIAGSVMLYRTKDKEGEERQKLLERASECFRTAYKLRKGPYKWTSYLPKVIDNIDIEADIAVDWWLSEGKYEELKKGK